MLSCATRTMVWFNITSATRWVIVFFCNRIILLFGIFKFLSASIQKAWAPILAIFLLNSSSALSSSASNDSDLAEDFCRTTSCRMVSGCSAIRILNSLPACKTTVLIIWVIVWVYRHLKRIFRSLRASTTLIRCLLPSRIKTLVFLRLHHLIN